ncbi:MAG TPA: histidinol-phosphatase [Candidatus Saccharimonadales bacterium]|nr:histidinol-phosphatase [Candidatus Saccharimonadales bacterium]
MSKYAFVDRDGTLIFEPQDTLYVDSVERLRIAPGMVKYLQKLNAEGYKLVMVTNQDHLGTSKNPHHVFNTVQSELTRRLENKGVFFDQILICPHGPDDGCACRKPKTGLVSHLKDITKTTSLMIGDRETDMQFAANLGIKGIKVETNQGILNYRS